MKATDIAFGLEKQYQKKRHDIWNVPHHVGFLAFVAGIVRGDGMPAMSWFGMGWLCAILCLFLVSLALQARYGAKTPLWCGIWLFGWCALCFSLGVYRAAPRLERVMPEHAVCRVLGKIERMPPGASQVEVRVLEWHCGGESRSGSFLARMPLDVSKDGGDWNSGMGFEGEMAFERYALPEAPGMFDARGWAHANGIAGHLVRNRRAWTRLTRVGDGGWNIMGKIERARREAFEKMSPHHANGIAAALVLGVTRDIAEDTREEFGRLGIAHLLAVSGLHFGLIACMACWLLNKIFALSPWIMRRIGRQRAALAVSVPMMVLYLLFVGAPVSAQRALIMFLACAFGKMMGRRGDRMRALACAGGLILFIDPRALFSLGFQLSFSAVAGVVWGLAFYENACRMKIEDWDIASWLRKGLASVLSAFLITVSTALTTAPFVVYYFGQLPFLGTFFNLVAIPFVSFLLMPAAIGAAVFWIFDLPGAFAVNWVCQILEEALVVSVAWVDAHVPLVCLDMAPNFYVCVVLGMSSVGMLFRLTAARWRLYGTAFMASVFLGIVAVFQISPRLLTKPNHLRITFVAMGQADATLVEFPNGHVMLVDAGSELGKTKNATRQRLIPMLKRLGIRRIDTLVVTHQDYDHTAGLPWLFQKVAIGEIWHNGAPLVDGGHDWRQDAGDLPLYDVASLPRHHEFGRTQLQILWPVGGLNDPENQNESSIILRIQDAWFSALLMGDAGAQTEARLISLYGEALGKVTVLKAGHHGSRRSSAAGWIAHTRPRFVIFSAGRYNRYRFPHDEVLMRIAEFSHAVSLRTDWNGTVTVDTDGQRLFYSTAWD